jgi:hypothetical protein
VIDPYDLFCQQEDAASAEEAARVEAGLVVIVDAPADDAPELPI